MRRPASCSSSNCCFIRSDIRSSCEHLWWPRGTTAILEAARKVELRPMNGAQEIERLKREIERLQKALGERQQLSAPLPQSLLENYEFVADCARYAENLISEAAVRKKYGFSEKTWENL